MKFIPIILLVLSSLSSFAQDSKDSVLVSLSYKDLDSIAMNYLQNGNPLKTIPICAIIRAKAKKEKKDSIYALWTSNLGLIYNIMGNHEKAELLLKEQLQIRKKIFNQNHNSYGAALSCLATHYITKEQFELAEPLLLESLMIAKSKKNDNLQKYINTLENVASFYTKKDDYNKAQKLLIEAIELCKTDSISFLFSYVNILEDLAEVHIATYSYYLAEKELKEAIKIRKSANQKFKNSTYTYGLSKLAGLYKKTGKHNLSISLYLETTSSAKKTYGDYSYYYLTELSRLSSAYFAAKHQDTEYTLKKVLHLKASILGKKHSSHISFLNKVAFYYIENNQIDSAKKYLTEAIGASIDSVINLDITNHWSSNLLRTPKLSFVHTTVLINSLEHLYNVLEIVGSSKNKKKEQEIVVRLAIQLLKQLRNDCTLEECKLNFLSESYQWLLRSFNTLDIEKNKAELFDLIEQHKSILLKESLQSSNFRFLGNFPDSLHLKEKKLLKKHAKINAELLESTHTNELLNKLNIQNQKIIAFNNMVHQKYPKYSNLMHGYDEVKIQEIQNQLDNKTALLEYLIGDSTLYTLLITKESIEIIATPINKKKLNFRIEKLHSYLSQYESIHKKENYQFYTKNAYWFYQKLLKKPLAQNKNIDHLIIVTDGKLGHLPFETFLVEQATDNEINYKKLHYLLNDYKISYNFSTSLWNENKKKSNTNNGRLFAMAASYEIGLDSTLQNFRLPIYNDLRKKLAPLESAINEVKALEKKYTGFFGFDEQASEKVFKTQVQQYSVIHLAMHGILNHKNPILSSLAFTEDSDSVENNFLQAYEISKLELNADLVVLSACETGYGKFERGNGITSLARSFMYAGAPALIVSLWSVNDYTTSALMDKLYTNLEKGMDKAKALQQAKLDYIKTASSNRLHPTFWAPFILIGNDNPINIQKKSNLITWGIGTAVFILLGIGFFILKKKTA